MQRYRTLPRALGGLHIFESVARHESFTKASRELGLTQPAVSRRIAALEERLNLSLFERNHNKLKLTAPGKQLLSAVMLSLDHLDAVMTQLIQQSGRQTITIACGFSFLSMWLQPRFSGLRRALEDVELRLIASEFPEAMDPKQIDIRIIWGEHHWPGREMRQLLPDDVFPVCSPSFAQENGLSVSADQAPERFQNLSLLHTPTSNSDQSDWERWFQSCNVRFVPNEKPYVFDTYQFAVQAAIEGEGIALGYKGLIDDSLRRGELVQIGKAVRGITGVTSIEFEPNRISTSQLATILEWFRSEIDVSA